MFYAVVFEGMPTVYLPGSNDGEVIDAAHHLAGYVDKPLRVVFVSAHNDPENGPSVMRMVWARCTECGGKGQHRAGAGEHLSITLCQSCYGQGFTTGESDSEPLPYRGGTSDMPYLD